jgi:hypothetical protein
VKDLDHIRRIVRSSFSPRAFSPADAAAWGRAYDRFLGILGKGGA